MLDDPCGTAEPLQRRQAKQPRALRRLGVPQAFEDELEIWRFDPVSLVCADACDRSAPGTAEIDAAGADITQDRGDERRLDRHALVGLDEGVVGLDRAEHRGFASLPIEAVHAERVREQAENAALESVELCQLILADPDKEVRPQAGPANRIAEVVGEPFVSAVVEEVLLELIEDHVDVADTFRGGPKYVDERATAIIDTEFDADCMTERHRRVLGPRRKNDDSGIRGAPQRVRDAGPEKRAFADAPRPVQDWQSRPHEVGNDDLAFSLAPEEEQSIEIGVPERGEAHERAQRRRGSAHCATSTRPACAVSAST